MHKIRKLTNTLDVKSRYSTLDSHYAPPEAVKLPALNAINKSVKYGDVSFNFSRDLSKLRKEPEAEDGFREDLAHSGMLSVRRKYDTIKREKLGEEERIRDLEAERLKYQIEKDKYEG